MLVLHTHTSAGTHVHTHTSACTHVHTHTCAGTHVHMFTQHCDDHHNNMKQFIRGVVKISSLPYAGHFGVGFGLGADKLAHDDALVSCVHEFVDLV